MIQFTHKENPKIFKIAAISDTHGKNKQIQNALKNNLKGDIFIHCGDFTNYNKRSHFLQFVQLVSKLDFKHKILIPGNHQILLDASLDQFDRRSLGIFHIHQDMTREKQLEKLAQSGITYLEHDQLNIEGIKIFASSYTIIPPYYLTAFQISEQKMQKIWEEVPHDVDLLITHGPAYQILDETARKQSVGSKTIRKYLQKSKVKHHVFGHIHESKGKIKFNQTMCYNVAEKLTIFQVQIN